jgi:hypothetical protein
MILNVFDFDDTLFRIPSHTTDRDFDLKGDVHTWYDNPVSLDFTKHKTQLIETVSNCASPTSHNIIITRRIHELNDVIRGVLRHYKVEDMFHAVFTIGHNSEKSYVLRNFLMNQYENGQSYERIEIYEDSMHQILKYKELFEPMFRTPVQYYFVDKTHLIQVDSLSGISLTKLKLVDENHDTIH